MVDTVVVKEVGLMRVSRTLNPNPNPPNPKHSYVHADYIGELIDQYTVLANSFVAGHMPADAHSSYENAIYDRQSTSS